MQHMSKNNLPPKKRMRFTLQQAAQVAAPEQDIIQLAKEYAQQIVDAMVDRICPENDAEMNDASDKENVPQFVQASKLPAPPADEKWDFFWDEIMEEVKSGRRDFKAPVYSPCKYWWYTAPSFNVYYGPEGYNGPYCEEVNGVPMLWYQAKRGLHKVYTYNTIEYTFEQLHTIVCQVYGTKLTVSDSGDFAGELNDDDDMFCRENL